MNKKIPRKNALIIAYSILLIIAVLLAIPKEFYEKAGITGNVLAQVRIVGGAIAPTFDHNISNFTINQSGNFEIDINCSDAEPFDTINYSTNFSGFSINSSTGKINQTGFDQQFVNNNTIRITCSDGTLSSNQTFVLTILDGNIAPVLSPIGPQIAIEGVLFSLNVEASDTDNDTLTFGANTALFSIDSSTGLINFTPSFAQIGNYTINITVFDGEFYDHEVISFIIVRGAFCGDGSCGSSESCDSCQTDCGSCPPASEPPDEGDTSGGGSGGGGSTTTTTSSPQPRAPFYRCDEKWECSDWSVCATENSHTRKCKDVNKCNTKAKKPFEIEECEYQPTCFDGIQNGNEEYIDCGGICEPCIIANCYDGIQNQDEAGVDCGGICRACEIEKAAKAPFIELPAVFRIPKQFPWILVLLMAILIISTVTGDQAYVRKLKKKKFDEFKERYSQYAPKRKKLYRLVFDIALITLIASFYIYYFSDNVPRMLGFAWAPIAVILLVPVGVGMVIEHYSYYEYKKKKKEEMLKLTHKREILQLISVENKLLVETETTIKTKLYSLAVNRRFDKYPQLYSEINPLYSVISQVQKQRNKRVELSAISSEYYEKICSLIDDKLMHKLSKDYGEFTSIIKTLKTIKDKINYSTSDYEESLIYDITEISKPHMKVVMGSSNELIELYNRLVELHHYLKDKNSEVKETDELVAKSERVFTEKLNGFTKKALLLEIIRAEQDFASVYNLMIDLFDHYMKKQELGNRIKNL